MRLMKLNSFQMKFNNFKRVVNATYIWQTLTMADMLNRNIRIHYILVQLLFLCTADTSDNFGLAYFAIRGEEHYVAVTLLSDERDTSVRDPHTPIRSYISKIIIKSLDPLRAKKTFIRKKLGHTAVSAIKASSVTL